MDHFVHTLPDGYGMVLNEESSNVSQGQMQLLTIARAVLADPRILILDEATNSVDTRTGTPAIQQAMDGLMGGAHQLRDRAPAVDHPATRTSILVTREGNIVEQGKHDDLLDRRGLYAELYRSQFAQADAI